MEKGVCYNVDAQYFAHREGEKVKVAQASFNTFKRLCY